MLKYKNFITTELIILVLWLVFNYFFGDMFRSAADICIKYTGRTDCYLRPEGFSQPLYVSAVNLAFYLSFFLYIVVFVIGKIGINLKRNQN